MRTSSTPPRLGPRGEGWVALQSALLALVVVSVIVGPRRWEAWALLPLGLGLALFVWSAAALGPALTPFPRPRAGARRVTRGPYRLVGHPMYVAIFVICFGVSMLAPLASIPTLLLAVVLALKARVEDAFLAERD